MRRFEWWPQLAGLAETQAGLFTAAQAQQVGARRPQLADLADQGALERIRHGVYLLSGSPVDQWTQLRAAWLALSPERTAADRLAGDPEGVVSHRTAALLLGLGDLDADRIELTIDVRRRTRDPDVLIHRGALKREDWATHEGLPVTTPLKTVVTLAMTGVDAGHLARIVRDAMLRYDIPSADLVAAIKPAARRYGHHDGAEFLQDLLDEVGVPISTVDIAAAAATATLQKAIANSDVVDQLARRINAQLIQDLQRSLSTTTGTQQFLNDLQQLIAEMAKVKPPVVPSIALPAGATAKISDPLSQQLQSVQAAVASALLPHVRTHTRDMETKNVPTDKDSS